jgi:N4-gp56 family major capsid protein
MGVQTFSLSAGRINKFKGEILAHAVPDERLSRTGRQVKFPKNNSDTYVARRWIPYGANAAVPNQFFANAAGDRGNAMVQKHLTQEGVTAAPESIVPMDVTVVMQQYSCTYGFTDKTYDLYEDDIPAAMKEQIGERVTLVNELVIQGALKAGTNQYYGGTGTTRVTVNGGITLSLLRSIMNSLLANHGKMTNIMLQPSPDFDTSAVGEGCFIYAHTDLEGNFRDLPNFTPVEKYASGKPQDGEIGKCERYRIITTPDMPSFQNAGAAAASWVGGGTPYDTAGTGAAVDVYTLIVLAKDAFSQVAVRGLDSVDPTFLPPGEKSKADIHGQRGYAGAKWWKAVMVENNGWMAIANVGRTV